MDQGRLTAVAPGPLESPAGGELGWELPRKGAGAARAALVSWTPGPSPEAGWGQRRTGVKEQVSKRGKKVRREMTTDF